MLPKYHILLGFLFTLILKLITPLNNLYLGIIFLASFLIDADHYFFYILRKKDFNFEKAYWWFFNKRNKYRKLSLDERTEYKKPIFIFHGIEFLIFLWILSVFSEIFLFIILGAAIHIFLDILELYSINEPFYSKFSQIITYIKNNNKKRFF